MACNVILLPLTNPTAFYAGTKQVVPEDGINLNRAFPGNAKGSLSARLAVAPVSYTHLDVYKRQVYSHQADPGAVEELRSRTNLSLIKLQSNERARLIMKEIGVRHSSIHQLLYCPLIDAQDVYKRQATRSMSGRRQRQRCSAAARC